MIPVNDQKAVRTNNQLSILNALKGAGPMSRRRLQGATGLSWGTITYLVNELIDLQIVREVGMLATGVGRPPVDLDLNTEANFVIGIWMGDRHVDALMLDIKGRAVRELSLPLDPSAHSEAIVRRLFGVVDTLIEQGSVGCSSIAGIGCAVPGSYNPATGVCAYAPNHPHWRDVPLLSLFTERYHRPVFIDHDMNCCVLGEHFFGDTGRFSNFVCVNIEGGIGAGIMINGEVYRGADNSAGELGHILVADNGPRCSCGRYGCLESVASDRALLAGARLTAAGRKRDAFSANHAGDRDMGLETVIEAARLGDKEVLSLFEEMGHYLGIGIGILITLFNPEKVILSGGIFRARDFLQTSMNASLGKTAWPYARADVGFTVLKNGIVLGAAGMVLQEIFKNALLLPGQAVRGIAARGDER